MSLRHNLIIEESPQKKWLSSFKLKVFFRLLPLFILLVLTIFVLSFIFALYHHYQDTKFIFKKVIKIRAPKLSQAIAQDDKKAIKNVLEDLLLYELVSYVLVEKNNKIYFQIPEDESFDLSSLKKKTFLIPKIRNKKGQTFYDFISPLPDTNVTLHVLIPCKVIDHHVLSTFSKVLLFGLGVIFIICLLAFFFSCWAAQEVNNLTHALQERERRYRLLWESSIDAIFLETLDGEIVDCNTTACKILGYTKEELIGLNVRDIVPKEIANKLPDLVNELLTKGSVSLEALGKRKDGTIFPTEVNIKLVNIDDKQMALVYLRDITAKKQIEKEREELQEQLRQAQKLEALGTLAGGVAHDFNNLLTVINGYAELALQQSQDNPKLYRSIELIKKAAEKAEQLTNQLLAFSRKQIYEPKIVNVNHIINDLEKMLRRLISEDIHIEKILAPDLPNIVADPAQIEQILINLVVNARDAINELGNKAKERKIIIETDYVFLDEDYVAKHVGTQVGPYVLISVSDTGIGMDEETKEKIFDPFFTTKGMGRGTGLGLATVYGIVKQNNASIHVYSELGQGTTFKIYWPAVEEKEGIKVKKGTTEIPKGREKVLLVEDDNLVRDFISNALKSLGYQVFEASNGKEALELIKDNRLKPDLLITDLVMPGMNGKELAEKIREFLPQISVLYISGYTDDYLFLSDILGKNVNFLQKPFTIKKLAQKVRQILDSSS